MTDPARSRKRYGPEDLRRDFGATRDQIEKLETYAELLRKWQNAINLVARDSLDSIWQRHFADSAQLLRLIPAGSICLDFGSGAGFPGMVIAMLSANDGTRVHLVESNARKCAFLRAVARQTGTAVEIHNARVEEYAVRGTVSNVDVVMARGVAPLARLLELSHPFFRDGMTGLFLKGRRADAEILEARRAWMFDLRAHPSETEKGAKLLEIGGLGRRQGRT